MDIESRHNACSSNDEKISTNPNSLGADDERVVPDEKAGPLIEGENPAIIPWHANDIISADNWPCAQVFGDETGVLSAVVVSPVNLPIADIAADDHPSIGIAVDSTAVNRNGIPV